MMRQLSSATRILATAATLALPTISLAQADTRPVVVVYRFDNNAIGANRADFDGMAAGVQDLLITDLASNGKIRLVDRTHLNEILAEQKLSTTGQVTQETAVRIGKILGAQYAITGGFMTDPKGGARLTARTIIIETTQIIQPQSASGKADDPLGLIADLSSKVTANMNLPQRVGVVPDTGRGAKQAGSGKTTSSSSNVEMFSRQVQPAVQQKTMKSGLDASGMKLFNAALDAMDSKNKAKAKELFTQLASKYQDFEPAKAYLAKVS